MSVVFRLNLILEQNFLNYNTIEQHFIWWSESDEVKSRFFIPVVIVISSGCSSRTRRRR